jgi:hypothetical protein
MELVNDLNGGGCSWAQLRRARCSPRSPAQIRLRSEYPAIIGPGRKARAPYSGSNKLAGRPQRRRAERLSTLLLFSRRIRPDAGCIANAGYTVWPVYSAYTPDNGSSCCLPGTGCAPPMRKHDVRSPRRARRPPLAGAHHYRQAERAIVSNGS